MRFKAYVLPVGACLRARNCGRRIARRVPRCPRRLRCETPMAEKTPPDPEFEALLRYIQESRGLDFRGYKRTSLRRRITIRMEALGAEDFAAYRSSLEAQPGEFEELLNTVLINVTSFFRDADAWDVLRD